MTLQIEYRPLDELRPYDRNARTHTPDQIRQIERSLARFGWATPIALADGVLIYGHARRQAALNLRKRGVAIPHHDDPNVAPTVDLSHLTEDERRAYIIADNKLAEQAGWDNKLLGMEMLDLSKANFDLSLLGFSGKEITNLLGGDDTRGERGSLLELSDITMPEPQHRVETKDHWVIQERHHLFCLSVFEDWPVWSKHLKNGSLFIPYPGPFVPFGKRAQQVALVMVQPDPYAAGMLLDRVVEAHGEASVERKA